LVEVKECKTFIGEHGREDKGMVEPWEQPALPEARKRESWRAAFMLALRPLLEASRGSGIAHGKADGWFATKPPIYYHLTVYTINSALQLPTIDSLPRGGGEHEWGNLKGLNLGAMMYELDSGFSESCEPFWV
jgi:hypothetical protein